ncbi:hypothetical protein Glove_94g34 [Diversispora epigaea]|uniref:Uncharacterized protein n=1 Tax=Diversispora epigaea TaxID=1348612 RepID=A0A397J7F9_9GLOM|nr:hypothetical protein Glove_94g34 [Diversispora epigaea]
MIQSDQQNGKLNPAEKFSYIGGWVLSKLLKKDHLINSHPKFSMEFFTQKSLNMCKKQEHNLLKLYQKKIIPTKDNIKSYEDLNFIYERYI